jgi:DNA (cytosine-5)-methyltransferase 1
MNGKENVLDYVLNTLSGLGYEARVMSLQALDYGIPSLRSRVFIIGSKAGFPIDPLPKRTHSKSGGNGLKKYVTAEDALSDLPPLLARRGAIDGAAYELKAQNGFQRELRKRAKGVYNHVAMNHSPRLVARFASIPHGSSAYKIGDIDGKSGNVVTVYKSNNQRLRPDQPSPCVTANFQSTHVHYRDHRTLTAREAARLMTFPDSFVFHGKRTQMSSSFLKAYGREHENHLSQYNQIGNAVPPMLAEAIGVRLAQLADCLEHSASNKPPIQKS